jgi:hypothetical protein
MFGASRAPHMISRINLIEDLLYKDYGRRLRIADVEWKPLPQTIKYDPKSLTLNFKNQKPHLL